MARSDSYSTIREKELFELLTHVLSGSSEDHKRKRIQGLEELQRRIKFKSIEDIDGSIDILLEIAKKQGHNQPESSLIVDSLLLSINKYKEAYQTVLNGLKGREQEEDLLFLVFSKVVLKLDYKRKRQAIRPLVRFLMSRDAVNRIGVRGVYDCLFSLGNEKLSTEIVKETSPYLDSLETCATIFSVRLCSKFADHKLVPKMLELLEKSVKGYFSGYEIEIERDICAYFERIIDLRSLPVLLKLLRMRASYSYNYIVKAVARVLDKHPYRVDFVLEKLLDERRNAAVINAILECFLEMEAPKIDIHCLLTTIRINWWNKHPQVRNSLHRLFVKIGDPSKPTLFEILGEEEEYDFALRCLREIGVSNEELSRLFPKPGILQVYNFLYSQARGKRIPKDLNQLWENRKKLQENVPGTTNWLEHLLLHIFASFNFVTLNVAPLKVECVDLVCFYPETLDLFIIGCTTGILKDDLAKMDALITKMENQTPNLFDVCSITPIVVCSEVAAISPSDKKYSAEQGIVVMQSHHIDKLLEMLNTNRKPREVIKYIADCKISQLGALDLGR